MNRALRVWCTVLLSAALLAGPTTAADRGIAVTGPGALPYDTWGTYHALIIGINDYQQWPQLKTAVKDATVLSQVLVDRYGFGKNRVLLRTDAAATRNQITADIRALATDMKPTDNLLVYYAGHGQLDDLTGDGYWIPVEGEANNPSSWISNSYLKAIFSSEKVTAKNVVVIADSCYSGAMLRGGPSLMTLDGDYKSKLQKAAAKRSRQVISSGGIEPVADGGADGHSLFAFYLITALKENDSEVIDLENLFHTRVWKPVSEIGNQRPNVGRLKTPMDRDGQFVLYNQAWVEAQRRRVEEEQRQAAARQAEEAARKQKAVAADQMAAIQAERQRLELERQKLEMERELMAQRQQLDLERLKIEKQSLELQKMSAQLNSVKLRVDTPPTPKSITPTSTNDNKMVASLAPAKQLITPVDTGPLSVALLPVLRQARTIQWATANAIQKRIIKSIYDCLRTSNRYELRYISEEDALATMSSVNIIESSKIEQKKSVLWGKKSFFDVTKSPQKQIAIELGKELKSDYVILINIMFESDSFSINLYTLNIKSGAMANKVVNVIGIDFEEEKIRLATKAALEEIQ